MPPPSGRLRFTGAFTPVPVRRFKVGLRGGLASSPAEPTRCRGDRASGHAVCVARTLGKLARPLLVAGTPSSPACAALASPEAALASPNATSAALNAASAALNAAPAALNAAPAAPPASPESPLPVSGAAERSWCAELASAARMAAWLKHRGPACPRLRLRARRPRQPPFIFVFKAGIFLTAPLRVAAPRRTYDRTSARSRQAQEERRSARSSRCGTRMNTERAVRHLRGVPPHSNTYYAHPTCVHVHPTCAHVHVHTIW